MKKYDFRSDTVTQPTQKMRQAMYEAEVGDDVYGDDPTINQLEAYCAQLTGKQAALFVSSGTLGNQLAIMTHSRRGDQLITHETYHTVVHEVGALAVLSGVFPKTIKNDSYTFTLEEVRANLTTDDIHEPPTTMVQVENATGHGTVWDPIELKRIYDFCQSKNIKVHMDGARIFNAAIVSNCEVIALAQYCDSLMFCLSKGLCAPVGSMLVGDREFIAKARKNRKMLGGGLRQAGILAAAGILAVKDMSQQLLIDHDNAKYLRDRLQADCDVTITEKVEINMVFFKFNKAIDHQDFHNYLSQNNILINPSSEVYRLVTSHENDRAAIDYLVDTIKAYHA